MNKNNYQALYNEIKELYLNNKDRLLFHGWHHINFVLNKSGKFADSVKADSLLVKTAALLHDINYIAFPGRESEPYEVIQWRSQILTKHGFDKSFIERVEKIINEAHTRLRNENISPEGAALSDADALFKVMPITPFLFSAKYIAQNNVNVFKWAKKIVDEQRPLIEKGIYFYTPLAKEKYQLWAEQNLKTIEIVQESFSDQDIQNVILDATALGIL